MQEWFAGGYGFESHVKNCGKKQNENTKKKKKCVYDNHALPQAEKNI